MISPELKAKIESWDTYNSTPYAPYVSLVEWLEWTLPQFDYWLKTGEEPNYV